MDKKSQALVISETIRECYKGLSERVQTTVKPHTAAGSQLKTKEANYC